MTGGMARDAPTDSHGRQLVEVLVGCWRFAQTAYVQDGEPINQIDAYRKVIEDVRAPPRGMPATAFGPLAFKAVRQR